MKNLIKAATVLAVAAVLLTGCSMLEGEPEPTSTRTPVSGTITMPEGPTGGTPAPTATATPDPSATASPFPLEGVNSQGIERDQAAEAKFLSFVGFGSDVVLDADGKTPAIIIGEFEDFEPTADYLTNIVYAGCASALADAATPPAEMLQRVINETAEKLGHATADDVMVKGYSVVIANGVSLLCAERFPAVSSGTVG